MIKGCEYQSDFARKYVESQLRGQPEARLVQLAAELGKAQDEDAVRAILGPRS